MRYLILSDIHSNIEALEAVLSDAEGSYDQIVCLGDLVDYGADPNRVMEWARSSGMIVIRGNHDRVCANPLESLEDFSDLARSSAEWTRKALDGQSKGHLEKLPQGPLRVSEFTIAHGSPFDEDEYLVTLADVQPLRERLETQLGFFGHTHVQGGFLMARKGTKYILPKLSLQLEPDHFYLVNPGSVGQPRDGDPRAAYAVYSPEIRTIEFRRAGYDIQKAAQKIIDVGLPSRLAARLYQGR